MLKLIKWLVISLIAVGLYFIIAIYWTGYSVTPTKPAEAAVVFGAAQYNGKPSPIFAARLDHAKELYQDKKVQKIVVTGGKGGKADITSEGRAGRNYLVDQGIDAADIIFEEASHSTLENIHELKKILKDKDIKSIIVVSDRFHIYRISKMIDKEGIEYQISPTKTSPVQKNKSEEFKFVLEELQNYLSFVLFGV